MENNSQCSMSRVQCPIDLVVPMVFPQDPQWRSAYGLSSGIDAARNVRFRSWGIEELVIQCCVKYMPWLRRIYILLASESQVQPWMKPLQTSLEDGQAYSSLPKPQLRLVFHRDFIPEHLLPCFNVNTIEMFLHRIPGLSEYFIYSNDDIPPLSPQQPEDFFRRPVTDEQLNNGQSFLPCQRVTEHPYPSNPNIFHRFVLNGLNMVAADFGRKFTNTWLKGSHSMQPMLRSTVEKVCTIHADRIRRSFTFARSADNFNQYIFPFYQHLSGKYIDHVPVQRYVQPSAPIQKVVEVIRDPNAGIVCINDNEKISDWEQRASVIRREILSKIERLKV